MHKIIFAAVLALGLAGTAEAAVVFGNGPPDQSNGSDMNAFLEADSFVVGSATNITQIAFWSDQDDATSTAATTFWGIYSNVGGIPGSALFSGDTALTGTPTGNSIFGLNEFSYQFAVSFLLNPGTYWLVLHNGPTNTIPAGDFVWAWSADVGNSQSNDPLTPGWVANDAALAFNVTGNAAVTPEPASLCLVAGGLAAAWLGRRKLSARS